MASVSGVVKQVGAGRKGDTAAAPDYAMWVVIDTGTGLTTLWLDLMHRMDERLSDLVFKALAMRYPTTFQYDPDVVVATNCPRVSGLWFDPPTP